MLLQYDFKFYIINFFIKSEKYFKKVKVSVVALIKIVHHAKYNFFNFSNVIILKK